MPGTLTSGYKIIKALGKRGLRGFYFSNSQYKALAKIEEFENAKKKISTWGFAEVDISNDEESLVDALKALQSKKDKGCLSFMILEPLFWILLGFVSCSS